jgi:hypothetical protein
MNLAREERDKLAEKMTAVEIADAKRLASEWNRLSISPPVLESLKP